MKKTKLGYALSPSIMVTTITYTLFFIVGGSPLLGQTVLQLAAMGSRSGESNALWILPQPNMYLATIVLMLPSLL